MGFKYQRKVPSPAAASRPALVDEAPSGEPLPRVPSVSDNVRALLEENQDLRDQLADTKNDLSGPQVDC